MPSTPLTTATTNFDRTVTALVLRTLVENLRKDAVWLDEGAWMQAQFIPGTNLMRYISVGDLSTAIQAPPAEGTPVFDEPLAIGYEEFTAAQAMRLVGITDVALTQNPHNLASVAAERVGFNALMTYDRSVGETVRDYITAPSTIYGGGFGSRAALTQASGTFLTASLVRRAVTELRASNVPTFPDGSYHGLIHPFVSRDLMEEAGTTGQWLDVQKYINNQNILAGEIGTLAGVRFRETNNATYIGATGAASANIFRTMVYGPGYFATGDMQTVEAYMVRPGGDHTDPLAQKLLIGWKGMWGTKVLGLAGSGPKFRGIDTVSSAAAIG
jgi:N4-gp56 family major capsid protein